MSKHRNLCLPFLNLLVAACLLALSACGGGGSSSNNEIGSFSAGLTVAQLNGTWTGTVDTGGLHTLSVTIAAGSITQVLIDGVDQSLTGTITQKSKTLFAVVLNGIETRLLVNNTGAYAVYVNTNFDFGVIRKSGTLPLPTFNVADVDGTWSGQSLTTDFTTATTFASSGTCASETCSNVGNGVTASMDLTATFSANFGNWTGNYVVAMPTETGDVSLLMSDDKNFVGFHQCKTAGTFPVDCKISAWVRQ